MTVEGESRNVSDAGQQELGVVRRGISGRYNPRTPTVDVAALLTAAVGREFVAAAARLAAAAALQAAQIRTQTGPGEEADQACRVARVALDAAEAAHDLAAREVLSYQLRAYQLRVAEDVP